MGHRIKEWTWRVGHVGLAILIAIGALFAFVGVAYAAAGDIGASTIDNLAFAGVGCYQVGSMAEVSTGVFVVPYRDGSTYYKMATWTMDGAGDLGAAVVDTQTVYDGGLGSYPRMDIVRYPGTTTFACFSYKNEDIEVDTYTIDSAGNITNTRTATYEIVTSQILLGAVYHTGDIFVVNVVATGNDCGAIYTIDINSDGTIGGAVDNWHHYDITIMKSGSTYQPTLCKVSGSTTGFALTWTWGGLTKQTTVATIHIATNGTITKSIYDSLGLNSVGYYSNALIPSIVYIRGTSYVVQANVSGTPDTIKLYGFTIDTSGNISNSVVSSQTQSTNRVNDCQFPPIPVPNYGMLFNYRDSPANGWVVTYPVDNSGTISAQYDSLTYNATTCSTPCCMYRRSNGYYGVIAYCQISTYGLKTYSFTVEEGTATKPTVTSAAATSVLETSATLNGEITSVGDENADYRGFVYDISTHADPGDVAPASSGYASNWTENGSYGAGTFNHGITSLTQGYTYYFRACAHNSVGWDYSNTEQSFVALPEGPSSFNASNPTTSTIDLSWSKGTGAVNTYIRGKDGGYPSDRSDGYLVYNNTGTSTQDTGLTAGHSYYYRAWSWVSGTVYSDDYGQDNATTLSVSISVSPGSYGWGIVQASNTYSTGLTYFLLTNTGTAAVDITIHGTDMTGSGVTWTLSDTATPGDAIYGMNAGLQGGSYDVIVRKNVSYNILKSNLAASGTQNFGLQLLTPTANLGLGVQVTGTITLTAAEHT